MALKILSTKLYIPPPRSNLVSRPRLLDLLSRKTDGKLILVSAPAGYGKTTLLSEWINQSDLPFAWLSLDSQDNEINRFLTYLIASLQTIGLTIDDQASGMIQVQQQDIIEGILIQLINRISVAEKNFLVVLDDYDLIQNQKIHNTIAYLLDNQPSKMRLVILTRTDPPLRLSKWRALGELCEIRAEDLRFTEEEAIRFLNRSMGLDLSPIEAAALTEKTEGWIAGIQLAAISLQKHPDRHAFINTFAGDDRYISDYLVDEVLLTLPPHIQNFLLQTSILDQLCEGLCNAVTERNDSQEILTELECSNLFLIPLDNQRNWYRYHKLFVDLLQVRLNQSKQISKVDLYRRASLWYWQHQLIFEAVKQAIMAGDAEMVARLIEGHLLAIASTSELVLLNQLLNSLPEYTVKGNPWLSLAKAWSMAYLGQLDSTESLIVWTKSALIGLPETMQNRLNGRILVLEAYLAGSRRDYPASIQFAHDALRLLPDNELSMRSYTLLIIGNAYRFDENLLLAMAYHKDAFELSEEAGDTILSVMILSRLIGIYKAVGQLNLAYKTGMQALEMVEDFQNITVSQSFIMGYLKLRLCGVYYERNELEMAINCAEIGLDLVRQWGGYDSISLGYLNIAKIYMALGNYQLSNDYMREFKATYPWEHRIQYKFVSAIEAEIQIKAGNLLRAMELLESCEIDTNDRVQFLTLQFYDVLTQVLIASGQLSDANNLLRRLLAFAEKAGAVEYEIRFLGRKALVLKKIGDESSAMETLEQALSLAAPEGYLRSFLDQGDSMAQLLYQASLQGIHPLFCNQLLEQFPTIARHYVPSPTDLLEPLSNREIEVLNLIAEGYTNREIAQALVLSLYTIKSHARNIFSKLGVKHRTEAVARARLFGLLE